MSDAVTPVLLIASGGLGREVAAMLQGAPHLEIVGFLDDVSSTWGTVPGGLLVLGPLDAVTRYPDADVVVCAGRGGDRARITRALLDLGVGPERFRTVIDPSARLGPDVVVGAGSLVLGGCVLTAGVTLGPGCAVMPNVTLTHDVVLEDHVTVCAGASLAGGVSVGAGAYIGMGATVRQHVRIGRDSTVGMGAAVIADVPDHETWAGVPARRVAVRMEGHVTGSAGTPAGDVAR